MINIFKKKKIRTLFSIAEGESIAIEEVPDEVFSSKMTGDGIAVIPNQGKIYSPCNGIINMIAPTKHAIGIISNDGLEILIHVGIDTFEENGNNFKIFVHVNDLVKTGTLLITYDKDIFVQKGTNDITMLIITNQNHYTISHYYINKYVQLNSPLIEYKWIDLKNSSLPKQKYLSTKYRRNHI